MKLKNDFSVLIKFLDKPQDEPEDLVGCVIQGTKESCQIVKTQIELEVASKVRRIRRVICFFFFFRMREAKSLTFSLCDSPLSYIPSINFLECSLI